MPSFIEIYYLGLVPAICLYTARGMWLAKQPRVQAHSTRRTVLAMCMFCAVTWPLSLPIGTLVKVSEWTHRDGWIDRYIDWAQRTVEKWRR